MIWETPFDKELNKIFFGEEPKRSKKTEKQKDDDNEDEEDEDNYY